MPTYKILESRPTINYWRWTVEAESEEEALNKVMNGGVELEPDEYYQEEDWDIESEYDIEEVGDDSNNVDPF